MDARDEFSTGVKSILAHRAGFRCSRPACRALTVGPSNESPSGKSSVGVAAHITAAAPAGPRYDTTISQEERSSVTNGVWLCAIHAKEIDDDVVRFPKEVLRAWKQHAEDEARSLLGRPISVQAIDIAIQVALHRASDDTLLVTGSTNLPDGTRIFVGVRHPARKDLYNEIAATVTAGMFAAPGFGTDGEAYPHGWYRIEVVSYFNGPWKQAEAVLAIVGKEGEYLVGRYAEPLHPEFAESEKRLRAAFDCIAPLKTGAGARTQKHLGAAVEQVKNSILTVDGRVSAMRIEEIVQLFMSAPDLRPRDGWSAQALPNGAIVVAYSFWSGFREAMAEWVAVLESGEVRYRNLDAKCMSWGPDE